LDQEQRHKIRKTYLEYKPILEKGERVSPYDIGIEWEMSPIEENVWAAIRYIGLPLYPQVPVGPYFMDFGDFRHRIGIEVDSVKFHTDWQKDKARQSYIEKRGWKIFRFPSRIVYKTREDFTDENQNVNWDRYYEDSAEGRLIKIYQERTNFFENKPVFAFLL